MVREKAARRGLSMARYVVELVLRREAEAAPRVALDAGEQREHLERVRSLAVLLHGDVDVPAFLEDMRRGIDAVIDTWALDAAREGRLGEVRATMAMRYGEAEAEGHVARIAALAAGSPARTRSGPEGSPGQESLF